MMKIKIPVWLNLLNNLVIWISNLDKLSICIVFFFYLQFATIYIKSIYFKSLLSFNSLLMGKIMWSAFWREGEYYNNKYK
jgi:hypothetical protein